MTVKEAQRILEDHGHESFVEDGGRTLYGDVQWSRRLADGSYESGTDWEVVPYAKLSALRDWLGY